MHVNKQQQSNFVSAAPVKPFQLSLTGNITGKVPVKPSSPTNQHY